MAYTKTYWDEMTAITAGLLNKIEQGIKDAENSATWSKVLEDANNTLSDTDLNRPAIWADFDAYKTGNGKLLFQIMGPIRTSNSMPLIVQHRTDDPDPSSSPVGMIYLRTDL
jgi:hypothetical protein